MKNLLLILFCGLIAWPSLAALPDRYIAVANRGDSSVSLLDSSTGEVLKTIDQKTLGFEFEPMYVSHLKPAQVFTVGDRKNNQLLILDDVSGKLLATLALSKGVFHQWVKPGDNEVVVATDGETGADLVKISRNQYGLLDIQTRRFELKGEHANGIPHDVVIDSQHFYLTIHDKNEKAEDFDKVLKVSRKSLKVEDFQSFSPDVHVGLPQQSPYLIVAEQSGQINFLTRDNMAIVKQVKKLPGAHGLYWNPEGTRLFSANIASSGPGSLYVINNEYFSAATLTSTLDSGFSKPHNLVADFQSEMLFLTHSGPNDRVSIYGISGGKTKLLKDVQTGANPFGIGIIAR